MGEEHVWEGSSETAETTIDRKPTIETLEPDEGSQRKGYVVDITGTNFKKGATLDFGPGIDVDNPADVANPENLRVHIEIDKNAKPGKRTVKITNPDKTYGTAKAAFEVL